MKYSIIIRFLIILLLILNSVNSVYANHIVGGELYYQCQGGGNYLVTCVLYKDCQTGSTGSSAIMSLSNSCGYQTQLITLNLTSSGSYVNADCNAFTGCFGGSILGIEKLVFQNTISINDACQDWNLTIAISSRSSLITTVINPDNYDLFMMAGINNLDSLCDNSPIFNNEPLAVVCNNEPYLISLGATDADNDSLAYHLIPPKSGPLNNLAYNTPYTYNNFMDSNPPLNFDSLNGTLYFTSTQTQVTLYAVRVEEYRNGSLIGYIERDIILYTYNCSPSAPVLSGINGTNTDSISICAYRPNCFRIFSTDPDITDSTRITSDTSIPGITMTSYGTQNDSVEFCWTPSSSDINIIPHTLNVFALDNSCAANQICNRKFYITVEDSTSVNCSANLISDPYNENKSLVIFPQPARERIYIDCGNLITQYDLKLTIHGILNNIIYYSDVTEKLTVLEVNKFLPPGMYIAVISDKQGVIRMWAKLVIVAD